MPKLLIVLVSLLAAAFLAACAGSTDDRSTPTATPAPTAEPTPAADTPTAETPTVAPTAETPTPTQPPGGAGGDLPETVVPAPTRPPSTSSVPADWATYTQAEPAGFTFRYPSDWYVPHEGRIHSWGLDEPFYPPGGILVDFGRTAVPSDPAERQKQGIPPRPPEATDTTLAGAEGWEIVRTRDAGPGHFNRLHIVLVERNGYQYLLSAGFSEKNADETTFLQILNSFRFTD